MAHDIASGPILVVPGWGGSGAAHWQTLWQTELACSRTELADWFDPRCDAWTDAIEAAAVALALRDPRPPVFVAHSLGCIAVAYWARSTRRPIRAALLVAPADIERTSGALPLRDFAGVPQHPLPCASLVVTSDDDPYVSAERAAQFARAWGSELRVIRGRGHLNASSGLGRWPEGRALLASLLNRTTIGTSEMLTACPL